MNHARWNVEIDGPDLLICFNDHEKSHPCEYVRYTPAKLHKITDERIWELWDAECQMHDALNTRHLVVRFVRAVLKEGRKG